MNLSLTHLVMIMAGLAALLFVRILRKSAKARRHLRMRKWAKKQLDIINNLPEFRQRIAYLRKINAFVFEEMLLEAIERAGQQVYRNKRYTGDGGIDGRATINGTRYIIQAKRYSGHVVTKDIIDFAKLAQLHKCRGIFCHTGKTRDCTRELLAVTGGVEIISGQKLLDLLAGYYLPGANR